VTAKVITITNAKGGAGKTTTSMPLAAALAHRGLKVLVIDGDPTQGATEWAVSADDDNPFPCPVANLSGAGGTIHREIRKFLDDYRYVIVDCPPTARSPVPRSAPLVSDLAIVPIIPSALDFRASRFIRELLEDVASQNEEIQSRLLLNQVNERRVLSRDAMEMLPRFGMEPPRARLGQREVYRHASVVGTGVHDFGKKASAAIEEVDALTDESLCLLGEPAARATGGLGR
jgi:chromosome partitioning protein